MTAEPIKFPAVTPSQLHLHKILCSRQNQFTFPLGNLPCRLMISPSEPAPTPEYSLSLQVNNQPVQFYVGRGFINQLLHKPLNDKALSKLPDELFKAAMVQALNPLLDVMRAVLSSPVDFISLEPEEPDVLHSGLTIQLTVNELSHTLLVNPNPMIMELITHLPPHIPDTTPDIPIWAELILGRSILSRLEISTLSTGDIVFLQQHVTEQQMMVRATRYTAFVGETENNQVTIRQRMELMDEQHPEAQEYSEHSEQRQEQDQHQGGIDLAELSVELLFEIGRQQFTAAEIQSMQEGYIFDLERPIEQPVHIRANGKIIAECQLVQIDNRLGARITNLFD